MTRNRTLIATLTGAFVAVAVLAGLVGARLGGDGSRALAPTPEVINWPPPPPAGHVADYGVDAQEVVIELRVWQHVEDPWDVWIQARPLGGDPVGPIPFPLDGTDGDDALRQFHSFRDLAIAGAELRLWQRYRAPELMYVRACVTPCSKWRTAFAETDFPPQDGAMLAWPWQTFFWNPLGMITLPLADGHSEFGHYRYGDLTVAVPVGNPGLAADREHLLALRDALAGTATLNWSAGTPTSEWEGVTVTGAPPRVTVT